MEREREQGSDRLDTEERKELNDSDFGLPEERKYPMPDATHVRAAESYFRYATDQQKPELAHNILRKAKEFGVDVESLRMGKSLLIPILIRLFTDTPYVLGGTYGYGRLFAYL